MEALENRNEHTAPRLASIYSITSDQYFLLLPLFRIELLILVKVETINKRERAYLVSIVLMTRQHDYSKRAHA